MILEAYCDVTIDSSFSRARELEDVIITAAREKQYDEDAIFALRLSLEEALTNAIRHGNGQDSGKQVRIRYRVEEDQIDIRIADEGTGFDLASVPDPTRERHLEIPSGRGILLMRAYMDEVRYNQTGNEVHLVKYNTVRAVAKPVKTKGNLDLTLAERGQAAVITLIGSADMAEANELAALLDQAIEKGAVQLVLDLSRLEFTSSMGLGVLIRAQNRCGSHGGQIRFVQPQDAVLRVLKTTRLDQLFPIDATVEKSLESIGA
jgi:serine/threonine-protein kinase RsbW